MVKCRVEGASASGEKIWFRILPLEGSVKGRINMPCPEQLLKTVHPRPLSSLFAPIVARRLIGLEIEIPLFGQLGKDERKRDLKKRGLWKMKDDKIEIQYEEPKDDKPKMKYSEIWKAIEEVEGVDFVEELDTNAKRIVFFKEADVRPTPVALALYPKYGADFRIIDGRLIIKDGIALFEVENL